MSRKVSTCTLTILAFMLQSLDLIDTLKLAALFHRSAFMILLLPQKLWSN